MPSQRPAFPAVLLLTAAGFLPIAAAGIAYGMDPQASAPSDSSSAAEPDPAGAEKRVTNVFYETSLRQVLSDIATQVGVIIVPDASVRGVVTCELKDVPLDKALEIVLAGTGFVVKKTPDYYLVCSADLESPSFPAISETQFIKLDYVKATEAIKLLSPSFKDYVRADADTNMLCITAPTELVRRIAGDLAKVDRPPRHCRLDARIVVMEHEDLLELGVQWGWPQVRAGVFTNSDFHGGGLSGPDWPWGLQIGYTTGKEFTDSLLLMLNLLTQNENATVLASPQLMAQDGKEAEIAVNTEEYFEIVNEGYYTQSTLQKVESGTVLKLTPRIGEDGDITLEIATEVSDVVGRGEKNLPVITRRQTKSTVRVEDGGTAAVAGLMLSRTRLAESGVPGLAALEGIGPLFRKDTDEKSSRQVAVFVTARLVPDGGETRAKAKKRPVIDLVGPEFRQQLRESLNRLKRGEL